MNWQKIETAPKDGTPCVFYSKKHGAIVGNIPSSRAHYKKPEVIARALYNRRRGSFRPTHWMPLHPPPIDED